MPLRVVIKTSNSDWKSSIYEGKLDTFVISNILTSGSIVTKLGTNVMSFVAAKSSWFLNVLSLVMAKWRTREVMKWQKKNTEVASFGILNLQIGTNEFRKCVTL
jgi:hypothetical protein